MENTVPNHNAKLLHLCTGGKSSTQSISSTETPRSFISSSALYISSRTSSGTCTMNVFFGRLNIVETYTCIKQLFSASHKCNSFSLRSATWYDDFSQTSWSSSMSMWRLRNFASSLISPMLCLSPCRIGQYIWGTINSEPKLNAASNPTFPPIIHCTV